MKSERKLMVLLRDDDRIEIDIKQWAEMLLFLSTAGWKPSVPTYCFLASQLSVSQEDASYLAVTGRIVLEETLKDPLSAFQTIRFDMGLFSTIVDFCEKGAFTICQ